VYAHYAYVCVGMVHMSHEWKKRYENDVDNVVLGKRRAGKEDEHETADQWMWHSCDLEGR
jgi:hypothetical protein